MTRIDFYLNAENKLRSACLLSLKAMQNGLRTVVSFPDEPQLQAFDQLLWRYPGTAFVPHCRSDESLASRTPVLLHIGDLPVTEHALLVTLHPQVMPFFSRFERVIELVERDEADKALARERYRFYRERGYALRNIDLNQGEAHEGT